MTAIATLCALSCAVAAPLPEQLPNVEQHLSADQELSSPAAVNDPNSSQQSKTALPQTPILTEAQALYPPDPDPIAPEPNGHDFLDPRLLQSSSREVLAYPDTLQQMGTTLAQIPTEVEPRQIEPQEPTPQTDESQDIEPQDLDSQEPEQQTTDSEDVESPSLEPLEIEMEADDDFTGINVQDRTGAEQQFSLEEEAVPSEENPTPEQPKILEVLSDHQEYNERTQIVNATGDVVVRFPNGILAADRLRINLNTKLAIAEGNVALRRGQQLLRGQRFEYFFVQNRGLIHQAKGEIYRTSLNQDLTLEGTPIPSPSLEPSLLLNDRLLLEQPPTEIKQAEGLNFLIGSGRDIGSTDVPSSGGEVSRIRFQAEEVEFFGDRWEAKDISLTNDPFSPPELQIVADTATYRSVDEFNDELVTTDTRLLIDQNISLPIYPRTYRFGKNDEPSLLGPYTIGFDDEDRGGLYIQRRIPVWQGARGELILKPQYLVQKALFPDFIIEPVPAEDQGQVFAPGVFALTTNFSYLFTPRMFLNAKASVDNFRLENLEDELKVNVRLEQRLGEVGNPFRLSQEYNYRDRLFNGSLGFQRVKQSFGVVLRSPVYTFGDSGFSLDYQGSVQNVIATTDRSELLDDNRSRGEINLTRYQGSVTLRHQLSLWEGEALPATRTEGLRYSPTPIVPYLSFNSTLRGVSSLYSSGDQQQSLTGTISLQGQLGHFARDSFDYTGFKISYQQGLLGETSPFLFDRFADKQTLSIGVTQHLFGPFRIGFQSSWNLDDSDAISTDYFLEYSRRTHGVLIRYNSVLQFGSISVTINDFDWNGSTDPFVNQDIRPVEQGVTY